VVKAALFIGKKVRKMIKFNWIRHVKLFFWATCPLILYTFLICFFGSVCSAITPSTPKQSQREPSLQKQPPIAKAFTALVRIGSEEFPTFDDTFNYDNLEYGIQKSLSYLNRCQGNTLVYFGKDPYPISHLIRSLRYFLEKIRHKPSAEDLTDFIIKNYIVYRSTGRKGNGKVIVTGYYEPLLNGSPVKTNTYLYPVYSKPCDLIITNLSGKPTSGRYDGQTIVPYYSRHEIETDPNFTKKAKPIAWVDDRVDLFFLHIQGSGQIHLTDGETINVHYNGSNGRPYRSIGKLLIDQNKVGREEMSMQKIRTYLKNHPNQIDEILHHNSRYIFFKKEKDGPLGCLGVSLTPARSAAFDRSAFPSAALAFIKTSIPLIDGNKNISAWSEYKGFVLNQDTGAAIKGPGRTDIFWGSGPYAEVTAGHLKSQGDVYFLILTPH
jgi:membrane-bound lytic murein transglycosylase A